ncbi:hypothetical protein D3C74_194040 [compost metagenome]
MNIPNDISRYHVYTPDGGHELQCILEQDLMDLPDVDKEEMICNIPVKAVIKAGYYIQDGYLITKVPRVDGRIEYDSEDIEH